MLERLSDNLMRECTCVTSGRKETNRLTVIFQRKKDHSEEDFFLDLLQQIKTECKTERFMYESTWIEKLQIYHQQDVTSKILLNLISLGANVMYFRMTSYSTYNNSGRRIFTNDKFMLIIPPQTKFGGYTGVTLSVRLSLRPSVRPCVTRSCPGHNLKSIKASNFKLHIQIGHIVQKCSVQER